jgi:hypothetical protein
MDDAERMPPLGAVKPRQKFFDVIHRAQRVGERASRACENYGFKTMGFGLISGFSK